MTFEEAERLAIDANILQCTKVYCPVIKSQCRNDCVAYKKAQPLPKISTPTNVDDEPGWYVEPSRCTNASIVGG